MSTKQEHVGSWSVVGGYSLGLGIILAATILNIAHDRTTGCPGTGRTRCRRASRTCTTGPESST